MKLKFNLREFLHDSALIADAALIILTGIDLIIVSVYHLSIIFDAITLVGFLSFGVIVALGKVWALIEGSKQKAQGKPYRRYFVVWSFFTTYTYITAILFSVTTIQIGGDQAPKPDYLVRSEAAYQAATEAKGKLEKDQSDFKKQYAVGIANTFDEPITNAQKLIETKKLELDVADKQWASAPHDKVKALAVFNRIPAMIEKPTPAIIFAFFINMIAFCGLETMIFVVATWIGSMVSKDSPKRQYRKRAEQPEVEVMVGRWVEANFSGDTGKIIERKVFKKLHVERKIPFSDGAYQAILDAAVRSGVITITGDIIEFNKNIAITKILSGGPVWRGMNKGG